MTIACLKKIESKSRKVIGKSKKRERRILIYTGIDILFFEPFSGKFLFLIDSRNV